MYNAGFKDAHPFGFFVCLCSREITPVHIFDKRDAVGLLVNPGRHCSWVFLKTMG